MGGFVASARRQELAPDRLVPGERMAPPVGAVRESENGHSIDWRPPASVSHSDVGALQTRGSEPEAGTEHADEHNPGDASGD